MPGNPLAPQGLLNRVKASILWTDVPALNITAPYLGRAGISLSLSGQVAESLPTMTGTAVSEEPYVMCSLVANLLRTQALGSAYKLQWETDAALGNCVVRPDITSPGIGPFQLYNMVISNVGELSMAGGDPGMRITFTGYYLVNSAMWN